jgi:hypothetical protein
MIDQPERCPGSLQLVGAWSPYARRAPCPACAELVETVAIDGRPCLVEHAPRRPEALPLALW